MKNLFEDNGAIFSDDRKYRFVLWRKWDKTKPMIMFIGLNPSTANENHDDPTIRRVVGFARKWGYGGVYMLNLFTYVSAYPAELTKCEDPLLMADHYLEVFCHKAELIVFAWGNFPEAVERSRRMQFLFPSARCFGKNKNVSPKHPLYLPGSAQLFYFN